MSKQAMEMALEALQQRRYSGSNSLNERAIAALKEAIKQQGKPVAWIGYDGEGGEVVATREYGINGRDALSKRGFDMQPLHTSAPTIPEEKESKAPYETLYDTAYIHGWNECRKAMLSAAIEHKGEKEC